MPRIIFTSATAPLPSALSCLWLGGTEADLAGFETAAGLPAKPDAEFPRARFGQLRGAGGEVVDEVVLLAPRPGTRVITAHGGAVSLEAISQCLAGYGAVEVSVSEYAAEQGGLPYAPGAGPIELAADLLMPDCRTETQAALLLTSRAELPGELRELRELARAGFAGAAESRFRERLGELQARGIIAARLLTAADLVIVGPVNAGKSTFFNLLLDDERAQASPLAGYTRDPVVEWLDLGGRPVRLHDTAGWRPPAEAVEGAAQDLARVALGRAELIVILLDGSRAWSRIEAEVGVAVRERLTKNESSLHCSVVVILNQADKPAAMTVTEVQAVWPDWPCRSFSCLTGRSEQARRLLGEFFGLTWDGRAAPFSAPQRAGLERLAEIPPAGAETAAVFAELLGE